MPQYETEIFVSSFSSYQYLFGYNNVKKIKIKINHSLEIAPMKKHFNTKCFHWSLNTVCQILVLI